MTDKIMEKMEDTFKKIKSIDEPEQTIKEEMANLLITIEITKGGYKIDTSVPVPHDYILTTIESVSKDLFVQHLFNRGDAPWMRKLGIMGKKK